MVNHLALSEPIERVVDAERIGWGRAVIAVGEPAILLVPSAFNPQ